MFLSKAFYLLIPTCLLAQNFDPKMPETVPAVEGTLSSPYMLRWIDVKLGDGELAAPGKEYTVHYTGWLRDGKKFDSSVDRKEPLKFVQGKRMVIAGWETGFEGMRVGGKRRLFLPYQLAYGELGRGAIPPKAELVFDVELLGVKSVPDMKAAAEVLFTFEDAGKKLLQLSAAIPEAKFNWRPAPDARSFSEVLLHVAQTNVLLEKVVSGSLKAEAMGKFLEEQSAEAKKPHTREEVLRMLADSLVAPKKSMEALSAGALGRNIDLFGTPTTVRGAYVIFDSHLTEHLGQLIAYCRMNGITPPWSKP